MATRLKTVEYWVPLYTSTVANTTDTNLAQITIYLPEGTKTFKSVIAHCVFDDKGAGSTNVSRRQLSLQLGSAGYSAVNNTSAVGQGGENWTLDFSADFTSYFTTNWSGTSMTCDTRFLATGTTSGFGNISLKLTITYEYNDDATTQIKTVWIPLDMHPTAMPTTKPGTATATIPQLTGSGSPLLPENSPTVRQTTVVVQGNTNLNSAVDPTFVTEIDTLGTKSTDIYECGSTVAKFVRFNQVESFTTTASHSWYIWDANAGLKHGQAWLVVTYEFTLSGTSSILNSVWLPLVMDDPIGGQSSSEPQRGTVELWVEEPATITTKHLAAYLFWSQITAIGGLEARLGTGSYVSFSTDAGVVMAGSNNLMLRNDSAFTLARGKNVLTVDIYRTDTTDLGWGIAGFLIVNYTSGVPSGGPGAANHTVWWNLVSHGTSAGSGNWLLSARAAAIPETSFFLNPLGIEAIYLMATTAYFTQCVQVERLSAEGGVRWESMYFQSPQTDPEAGIFPYYSADYDVFQQWPGDSRVGRDNLSRFDVETSRRWRMVPYNTGFYTLNLLLTYHTITFTVSGSVSGYVDADGAGLTVELFRNADKVKVAEATTTSGGSYTLTCYDNTGTYFATCREDSTHVGRSDDVTPS